MVRSFLEVALEIQSGTFWASTPSFPRSSPGILWQHLENVVNPTNHFGFTMVYGLYGNSLPFWIYRKSTIPTIPILEAYTNIYKPFLVIVGIDRNSWFSGLPWSTAFFSDHPSLNVQERGLRLAMFESLEKGMRKARVEPSLNRLSWWHPRIQMMLSLRIIIYGNHHLREGYVQKSVKKNVKLCLCRIFTKDVWWGFIKGDISLAGHWGPVSGPLNSDQQRFLHMFLSRPSYSHVSYTSAKHPSGHIIFDVGVGQNPLLPYSSGVNIHLLAVLREGIPWLWPKIYGSEDIPENCTVSSFDMLELDTAEEHLTRILQNSVI